jgi:hypothetical protein
MGETGQLFPVGGDHGHLRPGEEPFQQQKEEDQQD